MHHFATATLLVLISASLSFGDSVPTAGGDPTTPGLSSDAQRHLLESMMRFQLASATGTREPQCLALEAMLRRVEPPQDESARAREFLAALQQRDAVGGGASMLASLDAIRNERNAEMPLSVSEALRRASVEAVFRSVLTRSSGACCPCTTTASCSDNLFCTGVEVCAANQCVAGPVPCVDGDVCTTDACSETLNQCFFDPVPPPAEVTQLLLDEDITPGSAELSWDPVAGADAYNIYAGGFSNLADLTCIVPGWTSTSLVDSSSPAPLLLYLVSSEGCSESGLGSGTAGTRVPANSCP